MALTNAQTSSSLEVFLVFLKLGLTSFGGPVAHLGYFRREFVERRQWMGDHAYADLVSLCQFLPGPASSQVAIAVGLSRGGISGALAAWLGFTLPSALMLILFALYLHAAGGDFENSGWIHGLKVAAVAVVAQAVLSMARSLAPDLPRVALAIAAATIVLVAPTVWGQIAAIITGGLAGYFLLKNNNVHSFAALSVPINRIFSRFCLALFLLLLAGLPFMAALLSSHTIAVLDVFYRAGALVFGGGHVVLPLLQGGIVPAGWMTNDQFMVGYGAAQAVPGPLFTFAAYLGAAMDTSPNGWAGATLCLVAIFLPSFLLVFGALPFWQSIKKYPAAQPCLAGINACVVGILLAAFYNPVWVVGITSVMDFAIAITAFALLVVWKAPPWLVVALCAMGGMFL